MVAFVPQFFWCYFLFYFSGKKRAIVTINSGDEDEVNAPRYVYIYISQIIAHASLRIQSWVCDPQESSDQGTLNSLQVYKI